MKNDAGKTVLQEKCEVRAVDVVEAIERRRSIRRFKNDPIPEAMIHRILEAARLAPSAENAQPWSFIVVRDRQTKGALARLCFRQESLIRQAPVLIAACGERKRFRMASRIFDQMIRNRLPFADLSVEASAEYFAFLRDRVRSLDENQLRAMAREGLAIAVSFLVLAATELELGTCWTENFDPNRAGKILEVPDEVEVCWLIVVGFPAEEPPARARYGLERIVHWERYGNRKPAPGADQPEGGPAG